LCGLQRPAKAVDVDILRAAAVATGDAKMVDALDQGRHVGGVEPEIYARLDKLKGYAERRRGL
jgi:hypothetical protein